MPLLPATFEPFYQYDNETATWTGFLPELIHALAAEVDIDYEIVPQATAMGALLIDPTTRTFIGIDPNGQLATGDTDIDWLYMANDLPFMNVSAVLSDTACFKSVREQGYLSSRVASSLSTLYVKKNPTFSLSAFRS